MRPGKGKIALFLPSLEGGGVRRVMVNLARGFVEHGHPVDFVLGRAAGPYLQWLPPQVRVVDLGAKRLLFAFPALVRYLRRERPAGLLAAMDHVNVVAAGARLLSGAPTRVVVSVHGVASREFRESSRGRHRYAVPLLARLLYRRADAVVAVSRGVAGDLAACVGIPRERIRVIYNPVLTPEFWDRAAQAVGHPWFAPGKPPVVLSVGRLTPEKDFPTLLRALVYLRRKREARLVILGEGGERPRLEALAREWGLETVVDLPGFVDNPYAYMARAGVFALSSVREGFGNVLVEALAAGVPVVATDCTGGPGEILDRGRYGRLVPVGDPEALAAALGEALDHPRESSRRQERAREFTLERAVPQYLEVLHG